MSIRTEIFGKKVRKPSDIIDDIEFEYFALDIVQDKANEFIEENSIDKSDIITYKVKLRRSFEKIKKQIKGGTTIIENVEFIYARVYLSYWE